MDEFSPRTREMMANIIVQCLETGKCNNGTPLNKMAFQMMFILACGLHPKRLQELIDTLT
jgi:hypothetical protein